MELNPGPTVPLITPYHFDDIYPLLDHVINGGIKNIILLGTTGEGQKVPYETKIKLIKSVAKYASHSVQLLMGISCPSFEQTLELMKISHDSGAFASFVAPYIVNNNALSVIQDLLNKGPGDIVLYNFPAITNNLFIDIQDIKNLLSENRILGIKDSSGDNNYFQQLLKLKDIQPNFKVYSGPEHNLPDTLKTTMDGFVPSTGNICPDLATQIWREKNQGPWKEWLEIKDHIKNQHPNYILAIKQLLKNKNIIRDERLF